MIEDNDILFLSNGDDFIPPGADGGSVLYLKNGNTWETIPTIISGYKIGKLLGRGGFGEVRMGEHQLTKEKVALKFLRKAEIMSMGAAERTTTEIQCLSALRHAHIIRLTQVKIFSNYFFIIFFYFLIYFFNIIFKILLKLLLKLFILVFSMLNHHIMLFLYLN